MICTANKTVTSVKTGATWRNKRIVDSFPRDPFDVLVTGWTYLQEGEVVAHRDEYGNEEGRYLDVKRTVKVWVCTQMDSKHGPSDRYFKPIYCKAEQLEIKADNVSRETLKEI